MTSEPQDQTTAETDEPNEFGFAGAGTAPQPEPTHGDRLHEEAEAIAIPSGDITSAVTEAIDEVTERRDHS
ncbi:hypothetical protein ACTI_14950 [Actinoplanes sp. OR16]|uniref:hypothetical protein n=1 Tax=Actinoplanes sp. OR16 TaxID=946334 RepID=UPI000F6B773E|nr:hypothetical protein [Actinoplanes sp. OR16]BBH64810.1 hypothetical protein ACTI_14950 [Actinoplanes sp. OR16]